ncbi:unnamed protein product [Caenorhabditis brenneri]
MGSQEVSPVYKCAVCKRTTTLFNYGVHSCNACKMFFRRAQNSKKFPTHCELPEGNCDNCRYCRYQRCLTVGMNWRAPQQKSPDLAEILRKLTVMDDYRKDRFLNLTTMDDPTLDEIILYPINYFPRQKDIQADFYDWAFVDQTTSIEYMKQFDFVRELPRRELILFIKKNFMPFIMFCDSMRSYSVKEGSARFPDGCDVYPDEIKELFKNAPMVLETVRTQLIARLIELKVTREEFLLLGAVVICNPVCHLFSLETQALLTQHQVIFSTALFKYCENTYQQFGPSRFTDLLSICYIIHKTFLDFGNILITYRCAVQNPNLRKVFIDLLNMVMISKDNSDF